MPWVRIGDVTDLVRDAVEIDAQARYCKIGIYSWAKGFLHRPPVPGAEMGSLRYFTFPSGALVLSNIQAWEGAIAVSTEREVGYVASNRFLPYLPHESLDARFLLHFLASERGMEILRKSSPGTTMRNRTLRRDLFENSMVPLPDLPTQRAIAARLDGVARARDDISDRAGRRPRMSAIAPEAVGRALAALDLPDVPLASLYTIVGDVVRPEDDPGKADRFVGLEHVTRDTGNRTGSSGVVDRKGRKLRFAAGDVLYGYLRPYLNKVWVTDGPGLCSVEQYVLRPADGVDPRLLGHVLRQQPTLDAVNAATHNLQLPRIRTALLGAIRVPDIRRVAPDTTEALDDINERASRLAALAGRSGHLVESLLPAARNEEFAHLLAG